MRWMIAIALLAAACGPKSQPTTQPPGGGSQAQMEPPGPQGGCIKTGCSSTICAEPGNDMVTTCEFKPEYACYAKAACERQSNGACGFTQSAALTACLANPPAM